MTIKILLFTGKIFFMTKSVLLYSCHRKNPSVTDIILLSQEVFFQSQEVFSCDMRIFHHVTGNVPSIEISTVCVTWRICSVTGILFHLASSQEIFFLLDKVIIFSCDTNCTSCKRICPNSMFQQCFSCHKNYFSCERE